MIITARPRANIVHEVMRNNCSGLTAFLSVLFQYNILYFYILATYIYIFLFYIYFTRVLCCALIRIVARLVKSSQYVSFLSYLFFYSVSFLSRL